MKAGAGLAASGILALATAAASAVAAGAGGAATANVVDRTLACTTIETRGARTIEIDAKSGVRKGGRLTSLGQVIVSSGNDPSVPVSPPAFVGAVAGYPPPRSYPPGSLGIAARRCSPTRATVAFSTRRLQGGAAPQYETVDQVKCYAPRTVLVRVRADFARPVELKPTRDRSVLSAVARLRKAEIAVRTPGGKPLVYAEVRDSGRARLFTARDCF
jgi:hypothetical protein